MKYLRLLVLVLCLSTSAYGKGTPYVSPGRVIEVAKSGRSYDSLKPALAAAVAGDLVIVYPGTYNDSTPTLLKDQVNIHLMLGARIINNRVNVSQDGGTVFWDTGGAVRCRISGDGVIGYLSGSSSESFAIELRKAGSHVVVDADSIFGNEMLFGVTAGRLYVTCPWNMAYAEHAIRTRSNGFVQVTGNLYSLNRQNDGGGQAVYMQGTHDTVLVFGDIHHEGTAPAVLDMATTFGQVFILHGDIASVNSKAIGLINGKAYLYGSIVKTKQAISAENLYAYNCFFNLTGTGSNVLGKGSGDTLYLWDCAGDGWVTANTVVFGEYGGGHPLGFVGE